MHANIIIENNCEYSFVPSIAMIHNWAHDTIIQTQQAAADSELHIKVIDRNTMQNLNQQYRAKDSATNVLSFPAQLHPAIQMEYSLLGDIALCAEVINSEAQQQQKPANAHWAHMVIHGCLHLLGYDHQHQHEAQQMESLEIKLLARAGFASPY